MSKIIRLHSVAQMREEMSQQGYVAIVFMEAGNWACEPFHARVAEYTREFPFVRFCMMDIHECGVTSVGNAPLAYIPTTAFYRSGKAYGQIAGTDYAQIEQRLNDMRRDGPMIAPAPRAYNPGELQPSYGRSYRVQSAINKPIFPARRPPPSPSGNGETRKK